MRRIFLVLSLAAGLAGAGLIADRASAFPSSDPAGLRAAADALGGAENVHCVPGFWHHRWSPHDGCFRGYVAPRVFIAPRPRYRVYRRWRRW